MGGGLCDNFLMSFIPCIEHCLCFNSKSYSDSGIF